MQLWGTSLPQNNSEDEAGTSVWIFNQTQSSQNDSVDIAALY